jgi:hypothetical protein
MKNGFRVVDSDTHVLPAAEVIERYVDPGFRRASPNWRRIGCRSGRPPSVAWSSLSRETRGKS